MFSKARDASGITHTGIESAEMAFLINLCFKQSLIIKRPLISKAEAA